MTDKELKKLSRLEMLELLLNASKENERLREKIKKLETENKTAENIENLVAATRQVESALKYANSITGALEGKPVVISSDNDEDNDEAEKHNDADFSKQDNEQAPTFKSASAADRDIYCHILSFCSRNRDKLNIFPDELRKDIEHRINEILEIIKNN